jgi:hypothetical protein
VGGHYHRAEAAFDPAADVDGFAFVGLRVDVGVAEQAQVVGGNAA